MKKYPNGFPTMTEEEQNNGMQILAIKMGLKNPERFTSENAIAFWAKNQYQAGVPISEIMERTGKMSKEEFLEYIEVKGSAFTKEDVDLISRWKL